MHRPRKHEGRSHRLFAGLIAVSLVTLLLLTTALAEHEPSHRYFVSGFLTLPDGSPACGVTVEVLDRRATTDYRGWYRVQLHLHDASVDPVNNDVGRTLEVRVAGTDLVKTTTAVEGIIEDGWGESRVDFVVPAEISEECVNPVLQVGLYVGVPLGVLVGLAVGYVKVIKPWWLKRSIAPTLASLTGIGRARLRELNALGIRTLEDLARADAAEIARRTSIGRKEARRIIRRAREKLEQAQQSP